MAIFYGTQALPTATATVTGASTVTKPCRVFCTGTDAFTLYPAGTNSPTITFIANQIADLGFVDRPASMVIVATASTGSFSFWADPF